MNKIIFSRVFILFISVALTQGTISTEWELVQKDTRPVATDGMPSMLEKSKFDIIIRFSHYSHIFSKQPTYNWIREAIF